MGNIEKASDLVTTLTEEAMLAEAFRSNPKAIRSVIQNNAQLWIHGGVKYSRDVEDNVTRIEVSYRYSGKVHAVVATKVEGKKWVVRRASGVVLAKVGQSLNDDDLATEMARVFTRAREYGAA